MKTRRGGPWFRLFLLIQALWICDAVLAENVDPAGDGSQYAWLQRLGWLNAEPRGDGGPGVQVSDTELLGWIWAGDAGWISLSCQNTASCGANAYHVINDGKGNLSGYAWGEHLGWISFGSGSGSDCCAASGTPGCTDSACETVICRSRPSCCNDNWDSDCAAEAAADSSCSTACAADPYGVRIHGFSGRFSGLAWTERDGWIDFGTAPTALAYQIETAWRCADPDSDGVCSASDSCPEDADPDQLDDDNDNAGDACDTCPDLFNPAAVPGCSPPPGGLVGWWSLDEAVGTRSADLASGHDGVWSGPTLPTPVAGRVAGGLGFGGAIGERVQVADSPGLRLSTELTVGAWVFWEPGTFLRVVSKTCGQANGYDLAIFGAGPMGTVGLSTPDVPGVVPAEEWTHVAWTYDAALDRARTYVNGSLVAETGGVGPLGTNTDPLRFGNCPFTGATGSLDEIVIFDRELTGAEIAAVFEAGAAGTCKPFQAEADDDGIGDACDNCAGTPNPDQADSDGLLQWADTAEASSQFTETDWSANQATGPPDTAGCGDIPTAWAPATDGPDPEWLELAFRLPVRAAGVNVHETHIGGFIYQVDLRLLNGELETVWTGTDATPCPGIFEARWPAPIELANGVRIYTQGLGWEEIDAVELVGSGDGTGDACDARSELFRQTVKASTKSDFVWPMAVDWQQVRGAFVAPADIGTFAVDLLGTGSGGGASDAAVPPPGSGYWYLWRVDSPGGSFSTGTASQHADRDGALVP